MWRRPRITTIWISDPQPPAPWDVPGVNTGVPALRITPFRLAAALLLLPAIAMAQQVTPPSAGGPPAGAASEVGPDAGPARQPPSTDSPQAVNRGTDGSAVGLQAPAATGTTPQGFLFDSTAGAREPNRPVGGAPPVSTPPR
jgi:hypothetical protein